LVRSGELALIDHNFERARHDFESAVQTAQVLSPKERAIIGLGLAIINDNRREAHRIARAMHAVSPNDPDLLAIAGAFPWLARPEMENRPFRRFPGRRP